MFDLGGRVALVTGAGQGVGEGIARALAAQGAAVAVNDFHPERAHRVAAALGERAVAAPADVTDLAAVDAMVATAEEALGPVDILVNNAGIPVEGIALRPFREMTPSDWDPMVRLNLYGVLHCCRAVLDGMCERGHGRIITISSEAARTGLRGLTLYGASKAAALGFSRHLAVEVARLGVTVNALALGSMTPPGADPAGDARGHPVGRRGVPEDVAAAVVYLASDEAAWVTGQTFGVNGGVHQT